LVKVRTTTINCKGCLIQQHQQAKLSVCWLHQRKTTTDHMRRATLPQWFYFCKERTVRSYCCAS